MHPDELKSRVSELRWYHSINLGNGIITPGIDNGERRIEWLKLPLSFAGKTVLDIGAIDGLFAFEAERRGANRVLATDSFCWNGSSDWSNKKGFDLAKAALGSNVEELMIDVMDLSPERIGMFDVVLFLGVLYHLKHPLLALERVASVTREMIVIETVVDMLHTKRPAMAFYPGDELNKDPSNWSGPNPAAVVAMLQTVGFNRIEIVNKIPFWIRWAMAHSEKRKRGAQFWTMARTSRIAVHAWK